MARLSKKQLKELFEAIVSKTGSKCSKANPFIFQKGNFKCYVFIKNISPAYYPKYPDNSRVQLPSSDRFKEVIESELDFLILGYDQKNEVFGAWNPNLIKDRLNEKQNVSVYSRFSWQSSILSGEFVEHHLGNEEKMLLFKKESLNEYFDRYRELFDLPNIDIGKNSFERSSFTKKLYPSNLGQAGMHDKYITIPKKAYPQTFFGHPPKNITCIDRNSGVFYDFPFSHANNGEYRLTQFGTYFDDKNAMVDDDIVIEKVISSGSTKYVIDLLKNGAPITFNAEAVHACIRKTVDPLLKEHKVLQAVSALEGVLKNYPAYQKLSFKDYFKIVNEIYTDLNS